MESRMRGAVTMFADPVSKNRPGRRSSSTACLIASMRSGARWISSMIIDSLRRTKLMGSASAAASTAGSSSVR